MVQLTPEQQAQIVHLTEPVSVVDPTTGKTYVLIARETYEKLRHVFGDDPLSEQEQKELLLEAGKRAGWDDPEMEIYDDLDPRRTK